MPWVHPACCKDNPDDLPVSILSLQSRRYRDPIEPAPAGRHPGSGHRSTAASDPYHAELEVPDRMRHRRLALPLLPLLSPTFTRKQLRGYYRTTKLRPASTLPTK